MDLGLRDLVPNGDASWPSFQCANKQAGASTFYCYQSSTDEPMGELEVGYIKLAGSSGLTHALYGGGPGGGSGDHDIGVAPGGTYSFGWQFSKAAVVGYGDAADGVQHALLWPIQGGTPGAAEVLPMPDGMSPHTSARAFSVNDSGEVVGDAIETDSTGQGAARAMIWEPDATAPDDSGYIRQGGNGASCQQ